MRVVLGVRPGGMEISGLVASGKRLKGTKKWRVKLEDKLDTGSDTRWVCRHLLSTSSLFSFSFSAWFSLLRFI